MKHLSDIANTIEDRGFLYDGEIRGEHYWRRDETATETATDPNSSMVVILGHDWLEVQTHDGLAKHHDRRWPATPAVFLEMHDHAVIVSEQNRAAQAPLRRLVA